MLFLCAGGSHEGLLLSSTINSISKLNLMSPSLTALVPGGRDGVGRPQWREQYGVGGPRRVARCPGIAAGTPLPRHHTRVLGGGQRRRSSRQDVGR